MTEARTATARPAPYDASCTRCPRLAGFLEETRARHPLYWARPVPSFGAERPRILIVGLAPGMHGANRTARPFTGDHAGILLYQSLFDAGLASAAVSVSADDGLKLRNVRIANAVKCVPPQNKPLPAEIRCCNAYLAEELRGVCVGSRIPRCGCSGGPKIRMYTGRGGGRYVGARGAREQQSGGGEQGRQRGHRFSFHPRRGQTRPKFSPGYPQT